MSKRNSYTKQAEHCYNLISDTDHKYICTYCGMPADTHDHLVPLSILAKLSDLTVNLESAKIPCCRECNSLACAAFFESFGEKKNFIRGQLRLKYEKLLKFPIWDEDELAEMGPIAREEIQHFLKKKTILLERLEYVCPTESILNDKFAVAKVAKEGSQLKLRVREYLTFADKLTINNETRTIADWCITKNINYSTFRSLKRKKRDLEELFLTTHLGKSLGESEINKLKHKERFSAKIQ